jgi:hypothetical protein
MVDLKRVYPKDVHFTTEVFQVLADMNSHLQPDYREILKQYPYADGLRDISICQSGAPTDAENLIDAVRKGEYSWIGIGWLIFITGFVNAAKKKGMTPIQYADWIYEECKKINDEVGYRAAWIEAYGEIGNSVTWPKGKRFTKKEALTYFRAWLRDGRSLTEHWGSVSPAETLSYFAHAKRQDADFRNLPIYYSEGTLYSIHEAFRNGFPLVVYEGGCGSMDSFQTGIAFTRGGAKMFDGFWGIDLSPWTGGFVGTTAQTNNSGTWREGMTPECLFRIWLTSYMAGCNSLLHEVGYCFFYTFHNKGKLLPSDFGYRAMQFYRLTQETLSDRGQPVVPFAIMLEEEHGYRGSSSREYTEDGKLLDSFYNETPDQRLNIWANRVKNATPGDWQVHRMISGLFPSPDNLWSEFAGKWPDEKIPDFNTLEPQMRDLLGVGEIDPRDSSMFLRDSRWADCFDVIIEDTNEEVLNKYYKGIFLAGDIRTDQGLWARLCRYAENGGQVVMTFEQLDETAKADLGITRLEKPEILTVKAMKVEGGRIPVKEKILLNIVDPAPGTFKVWGGDETTGRPLVLDFAKGKGNIYLMLCAYGMDKDAKRLSTICTGVIDHLYSTFVGITKTGPGIQMLVNVRKDETLVTLLNHTGKDWQDEIIIDRKKYTVIDEVREVVSDQAYPDKLVKTDDKTIRVQVRVPRYETKIISFGPKRQTQPFRGLQTTTSGETDEGIAYMAHIRKQGPKAIIGTV